MQKTVFVESINSDVIIARRKGTRTMRLSVRSDGRVRLSMPYGIPEIYAKKFLNDKAEWIQKHQKPLIILNDMVHIGKSHVLKYIRKDTENIRSRLSENTITVTLPTNEPINSVQVQKTARLAAEKALSKEAAHLLPQRLEVLAKQHNINYSSCHVKKLKSRWGSCDSRKNIALNTYLIQLEWSLIDYVILHELTHTIHQHHQIEFWQYLENLLPDYKQRRKVLKSMPTDILITTF